MNSKVMKEKVVEMMGNGMSRAKKGSLRGGFTLIELIMVIAILAIISSLAITKFIDLKEKSANRVNISSMQNLQRAIETYIISADQKIGLFSQMDALIDVGAGGSWRGTAGQYDFSDKIKAIGPEGIPGIYRGPKSVTTIRDGGGTEVSPSTQSLEKQRERNQGITKNLADLLGIYYLKDREVQTLKDYGVSTYLLHNYTAGQAFEFHFQSGDDNMPLVNGGPGFRVHQTPFYPSILTNGSPVAVINPATGLNVFKAMGYDPHFDKDVMDRIKDRSQDKAELGKALYDEGKISTRLICFGLGSECNFAQKALDTVPRSEVLGREYYSQYILVFMQKTSGREGYKVSFAGVLDPEGNCIDDARFKADWR